MLKSDYLPGQPTVWETITPAVPPPAPTAPVASMVEVFDNDGELGVDARELHTFLEVGRNFAAWITGRIAAYHFVEGDYYIALIKTEEREGKGIGGQTRTDYTISLGMAKELSIVEKNAQGKRARKYFIKCEKVLRKASAQPMTPEAHT